jgi:hypothetical protein
MKIARESREEKSMKIARKSREEAVIGLLKIARQAREKNIYNNRFNRIALLSRFVLLASLVHAQTAPMTRYRLSVC